MVAVFGVAEALNILSCTTSQALDTIHVTAQDNIYDYDGDSRCLNQSSFDEKMINRYYSFTEQGYLTWKRPSLF